MMQTPTIAPFPGKQTEFFRSRSDRILYGGARGGGKSFDLALKVGCQPVIWHYEYNGHRIDVKAYRQLKAQGKSAHVVVDAINIDFPDFKALLIRRTYPQLEINLKPECDKIYPLLGGHWIERSHCYEFPSGARIYLRHCKDRNALNDFIGGIT